MQEDIRKSDFIHKSRNDKIVVLHKENVDDLQRQGI